MLGRKCRAVAGEHEALGRIAQPDPAREEDSRQQAFPGTRRNIDDESGYFTVSDRLVAIGGGEISRDEFIAAMSLGKNTRFISADMNHALAREAASKKGLPAPTDFRGALAAALSKP